MVNAPAVPSVSKSFADVIAHFKARVAAVQDVDSLDVILEPEMGLASKLHEICAHEYDEAINRRGMTEDESREWKLERDTWDLIGRLYTERSVPDESSLTLPTPLQMVQRNPYTPTSSLAHRAIKQHTTLRELCLVREWLHETAPGVSSGIGGGSNYRALTKHRVVHARRGVGVGAGAQSFVTVLDPDAEHRKGGGGALDADDAAAEKALSRALFGMMRAGKYEEARALCRVAGHDWRAAMIGGVTTFKWDAVVEKEEEDQEDGMDVVQSDDWIGNKRRKLWSDTCQRTAMNTHISPESRALAASLAPARRTLPALLPQCRTFADHAWAHTSALVEERVAAVLEHTRSWWEVEDADADVDGVSNSDADLAEATRVWESDVRAALAGLRNVTVDEGFGADHPMHWTQIHCILGDINDVLEIVAERLNGGLSTMQSNWIRFFAHLCLFLTMIKQPIPANASAVILEAYIRVLESENQGDLVALYVSALGDNAVERYALYLASLPDDLPREQRSNALSLARQHNLLVERVAIATAGLIAKNATAELPSLNRPLPTTAGMDDEPTPTELRLVRSVQWLLFNEETWQTAIHQSNAVLRYMLGMGRLSAARILIKSLPDSLASSSTDGGELLGYIKFFGVWDSIKDIANTRARDPGLDGTKAEKRAWEKEYKAALDEYYEATVQVLITYWLELEYADPNERKRERVEQSRIRQIYVPEMILQLHHALYMSRDIFPANLRRALQLPNIVADARYGLFKDFISASGNRMPEYLRCVREASIAVLTNGITDPVQAVVG
ncbi:Nucleoporin nup84 [Ceratobasidium sp. 395]|nr:Nucleoporin nup84 [Ceratobasidium sp. 395]